MTTLFAAHSYTEGNHPTHVILYRDRACTRHAASLSVSDPNAPKGKRKYEPETAILNTKTYKIIWVD